jgi:transcriptional regulator of arginine metabolism
MRRREEILRIVRSRTVHSQEELLELLRKEGLHTTQPTLSRDIRELGLAKTPNGYVAPGETVAPVLTFTPKEDREHRLEQALTDYALSVERGGNVIVLKTPPAEAQPLARALDSAELPGVLGTIAGDDTIFLTLSTGSAARSLLRRLREGLAPSRPDRRVRA